MTSFDFSNAIEEWSPSGEHDYLFRNISTDEEITVPGDTIDGAWESLYHLKGEDWHRWGLIQRTDIAERLNNPRIKEVSVHYARRNGGSPSVPVRED